MNKIKISTEIEIMKIELNRKSRAKKYQIEMKVMAGV